MKPWALFFFGSGLLSLAVYIKTSYPLVEAVCCAWAALNFILASGCQGEK